MVELRAGTVFAGHRIEGIAGEGGMGVVYRATHLTLEIPVAIKVIRPELAKDAAFRERFKRESRVAASIEHPNVLPVRHAGDEDGLLYITMRYVDGTDLRALIDHERELGAPRAVGLIGQVSDALEAAHAHGLVHRDVKPANVLIERDGNHEHAYLTDFGLTRKASSQSGLTRTGQWVGTLDYVAPEQIEGRKVDGRADIYALGCLLFEMLAGEVPYVRESEVATIYAHLNEDPPSARDVEPSIPAELDEVVRTAMAKSPEDRFQTAAELGGAARATEQAGPRQRGEATKVATPRQRPKPETRLADTPAVGHAPAPPAPAPPAAPPAQPEQPPQASEDGRRKRSGPWIVLGVALAGVAAATVAVLLATGVIGGGGNNVVITQNPAANSANSVNSGVNAKLQARLNHLQREINTRKKSTGGTTTAQTGTVPSTSGISGSCGDGLGVGPHTSCPFAENVRRAYEEKGGGDITIRVFSPVTGQSYTMVCVAGSAGSICTGPQNIAVYFQ